MIFNSIDFALFLPIVFLLYWLLGNKQINWQNILLVFASYFFYGWWDWKFISLIFFSSLVDFVIGNQLAISSNQKIRKTLLITSLVTNLGMLFFFKYFNFFVESFYEAFSFFGHSFTHDAIYIILPVGISFYTFQTLSYTIDIYRRQIEPTKDPIAFFAFVSFFPQLVAGPIERASNLLPQFSQKRSLNHLNFIDGMQDILWGLFKKVVIADRLAIVVNEIYNNPSEYQGLTFVLATVLFAFQIYCDFSGYSKIAIGVAKLFGFRLMENFKTPYYALSLGDFWRRWHISLSAWFRDYLYIPLGGNRIKVYRNLLVTFVISGLWHGASWTFVAWGAIHGVFLILEYSWKQKTSGKSNFVFFRWILTFSIVCFGWVFFRANSIQAAFYIITSILDFSQYSLDQLSLQIVPVDKNTVYSLDIFLSYFLVGILFIIEFIFTLKFNFKSLNFGVKLTAYTLAVVMIYLMGVFDNNEFIYFQF
jgi:alginate O-acetyltransferase complex protein AlgI